MPTRKQTASVDGHGPRRTGVVEALCDGAAAFACNFSSEAAVAAALVDAARLGGGIHQLVHSSLPDGLFERIGFSSVDDATWGPQDRRLEGFRRNQRSLVLVHGLAVP